MTNGEIGNAERGRYTLRRDEKSTEVIDRQRVVRRPLRKRVCNPLKRKDLNVKKAEMEMTRGERVAAGDRHFEAPRQGRGRQCEHFGAQCKQTQDRITESYMFVNTNVRYHSNGAGRR